MDENGGNNTLKTQEVTLPTITIEVRRSYTAEQETQIIDAVHAAMMTGIQTPEWDKTIRFIEHPLHRFTGPPSRTDRYTLITFDMFSGRSLEAKRRLYATLVENLAPLGIPPENWGVHGGKPASEVDIGFNIKV
jgi:phenylpyruvate tautomerase PptA (4-oxalocrotonate tautomerase family)